MIIFLLIIPVTLWICSVDIGGLYCVMLNTYSIHSTLLNTNLTFFVGKWSCGSQPAIYNAVCLFLKGILLDVVAPLKVMKCKFQWVIFFHHV